MSSENSKKVLFGSLFILVLVLTNLFNSSQYYCENVSYKKWFAEQTVLNETVLNEVVAKAVNFDWESTIEDGPPNSFPGTTGAGVPGRIQSWLLSSGIPINDDAPDYFGSEAAVKEIESNHCGGWDAEAVTFGNPTCVESLNFESEKHDGNEPILPNPNEIDIVTPSIRNLDFLDEWREFFQGFHVIIIQDGDQEKTLKVPDWVDYELHKRVDIIKALGDGHWVISQRDASIRNYGFLLSKKRYVYTIDDDCRPAFDSRGRKVNPLAFHYRNLKTPSTPYMFNTLYDPYTDGSDFVRGYPYSLRAGVPTGVSHGLWMNQPDYDAPTQLLKIDERVTKMHEMVMTVPGGIFFPLCSMNVAFDRELIGPAMMQGLMGEGQPWARYDDMFSGWAAKSVADHLGIGIKNGMPYIRHDKASNPFVNLRKEYLGLWWQESLLRFFMRDVHYTAKAITPSKAYKELAVQIRSHFKGKHEYFDRLANAMEIWTDFWDGAKSGKITFEPTREENPNLPIINNQFYSANSYKTEVKGQNLNLVRHDKIHVDVPPSSDEGEDETWVHLWHESPSGKLSFKPSRSSKGDDSISPILTRSGKKLMALVTYLKDEPRHLEYWLHHYRKYFPCTDIYILDNESNPPVSEQISCPLPANIETFGCDGKYFDHYCLTRAVENMTNMLLKNYETVVFSEVDELIWSSRGLRNFVCNSTEDYHRVESFQSIQRGKEVAFDVRKPFFSQRSRYFKQNVYDKPLIIRKSGMAWGPGFHDFIRLPEGSVDPNRDGAERGLWMLHLKHNDFEYCLERKLWQSKQNFSQDDANRGWGVGAVLAHPTPSENLTEVLIKICNATGEEGVPYPGVAISSFDLRNKVGACELEDNLT